jgi:hypothetical protein
MTPEEQRTAEWLVLRDRFIAAALKLSESFTPAHHIIIFEDWNNRLRALTEGTENIMRPISTAAWQVVWRHLVYGTKLEFTRANADFYLEAERAHLN